ncbi:MAG: tRNA uracil 4-sulfurtransferase ThiI [Clostridia bacterium]|jgi:thiamine biosynthesis protein ThiI|nr:tRNA 4-thiouridine(8) synthase ThiI [Clostridia bacterium]MDH7572622.1 tRNA uracil 4-sulfurtransferase ThiI [Clostridia bacterium]
MYQVVLVRYGEIALKGQNRYWFERTLLNNIRRHLKDLGPRRIGTVSGRVIVSLDGDWEEVKERLAPVCGIVSFSPARVVAKDMSAICRAALEEMSSLAFDGPATFKVEARRADKTFPFTSPELAREVGAFVLRHLPDLKVDLHRPRYRLSVELRREGTYVYTRVVPGQGGLPVGVSGRGVLMLSGGIDSPVAGFFAARRGVELVPLHFHSFPFTSERSKEKAVELCRVLARYAGPLRLHVAHFTDIQKAIVQLCPEELRVTIMRRMMLRVATRLAEAEGAIAIFTGESLGQVASQTMESLAVIGAVTDRPVLRPLIGFDKAEIVEKARELGTYEISIRPYEDCCTLFVPPHPATKPRREKVEAAESRLDVKGLVEGCLGRMEIIEIEPRFSGFREGFRAGGGEDACRQRTSKEGVEEIE